MRSLDTCGRLGKSDLKENLLASLLSTSVAFSASGLNLSAALTSRQLFSFSFAGVFPGSVKS